MSCENWEIEEKMDKEMQEKVIKRMIEVKFVAERGKQKLSSGRGI